MDRFRTMTTSTYDVHDVCNLKCEGCSYFVTPDRPAQARPSDAQYDAFFAKEAARGINYPIFSGAEPSLDQRPLHIAARHWAHGAVFTNGTRKIDPALPFRVVVSLWSGPSKAERLRGADTYAKALRTAQGDKRAIVFMTLTKDSFRDVPQVVEDCAARGLEVSFNIFSMSSEYRRRIDEGVANDEAFFRFSSAEHNLTLDADDLEEAATLIEAAIGAHPGTVLFTKSLVDLMCRATTMHAIDPQTNLALDCAILNSDYHVSYNYDLSPDPRKGCSAPDFDCRECRVLGAALATAIHRNASNARACETSRRDFRELRRLMMRLYFWGESRPAVAAS